MIRRFLTLALLPLLAGCSSLRFAKDWDREVDFEFYRTYEFARSPEQDRTGPETSNTTFLDKRIKRAIADRLEKKELRAAPQGERGDLVVVYRMNLRDVVDVYGYGYGSTQSTWKEGTLVIDFVDRRTDAVVWRGWAEGMRAEVGHSEEQIFAVVGKILSGFPPG